MVFPFLTYDANIEGRKHEEKNIRKQFPVTVVTNMKRQRRQRRFEGASV